MNLNLITILTVSGLSIHVLADRNGDRGGRWGGGQSDSTSPRSESAAPARYTPAPTARYDAPQATERTYAPSQQAPSERTYTPSQTFKTEPTRTRNESFQTQEPQRQTQQRATVTPRYEQTVAPSVARTQPVAQPTQPATTPRNTFQGVHGEPEHTARVAPTARDHFEHEKPAIAQTQPVTEPTTTAPRTMSPSREINTQRHEQPRTVQITSPRTDSRITEKEHSPFIFEGKTSSRHEREGETTRAPVMGTSPISQAQQQAVSLRSPQNTDSRTREPDHYREAYASHTPTGYSHTPTRYPAYNNTYYAHHYPSHTEQNYRPVTCYNRSTSFWQAFGFTMGASLLAPFYIAPVIYPSRSYYTWYGSPVVVSVSSRSHYPAYAYRPYYCNTGYIHDGWHYSSAYYGGWRGNWYGGFSYMFNPFPVYSSYYLYDEPQTIVVQQPEPQVVYVNPPSQPATPPQEPQVVTAHQPVQPAVPPQESILDTAPLTTQPQPAVEPATTEQQPAVGENTRCFCACKCNGRVPCICEYACGSEFAYSPEAYTLKGFSSYSVSLNKELIWSSYAGLDRAEPESLVAEATEQ